MAHIQNKEQVAQPFKKHASDTGSIEVQIALLSDDIKRLTEHFKSFPKDFNSKRGLLTKVSRRKTFLNYLKRKDEALYKRLINELNIRS